MAIFVGHNKVKDIIEFEGIKFEVVSIEPDQITKFTTQLRTTNHDIGGTLECKCATKYQSYLLQKMTDMNNYRIEGARLYKERKRYKYRDVYGLRIAQVNFVVNMDYDHLEVEFKYDYIDNEKGIDVSFLRPLFKRFKK